MTKVSRYMEKEKNIASAIGDIENARHILSGLRSSDEEDWHFLGMVCDVLLMATNRLGMYSDEIRDKIEELED